jgi:AraC-like DNA-binding protein
MENPQLGLQPRSFETGIYHPRDQFDAWRSYLSETIEISPDGKPLVGFLATAEDWIFDDVRISRYFLSQAPARRWRHRPGVHSDDWCLVLDWGREAAPIVAFRSLSLPFDGRSCDSHVIALRFPRSSDDRLNAMLDAAHGRSLIGPVAELLASFVGSFVKTLPDMRKEQVDRLAVPLRSIVMGCVAPQLSAQDAGADDLFSSIFLSRARHVVRQNLAFPEFGPAQLSRLLAVSRSKLYRSMEAAGGVAAFIQRERLEQARRYLSNPHETRSVQVIATEVGFPDHSTFSRSFRRELGQPPREYRETALSNQVTPWRTGSAG